MTKTIVFKIDDKLLQIIDKTVKDFGYTTRTDFLKAALHEKIEKMKYEEAIIQLTKLKGSSKIQTTDEQRRKAREEAYEELCRKKGFTT